MEYDNRNPADILNILVATDIHLGFNEKEVGRVDDSFITFEEILSLAKEKDVDFILLGGDLFHENKPSRYCLHKCIELLKKYTFGNKPIEFEIVNERNVSDEPFLPQTMNYEDPNLNVSYPVFTIHGNHDDPTGRNALCTMDLLSAMGLVNHFGKCLNLEEIELKPLLFQKGLTKLALYGLGAIRDHRLHRIFREGRVSMVRPSEMQQDWCNVLVVHQNRAQHTAKAYLSEEFLEDFIDLVIWGHEHECLLTPRRSAVKDFFISQPGSSVATSLSVGEAVQKHVGLLHIHESDFWMEEIPLKTVRPFCIEDISLTNSSLDLDCKDPSVKVMEYCKTHVEQMIERSKDQLTRHWMQPTIPLIRLRVEFEKDDQTFSIVRFGQKFVDKIANVKDIIIFHRKRQIKENNDKNQLHDTLKATEKDLVRFSAVELVRRHFDGLSEKERLQILTEKGLGAAVQEFVDKREGETMAVLVKHQLQKSTEYLNNKLVTEETLDEEIFKFQEEKRKATDEDAELDQVLVAAKNLRVTKGEPESDEEMEGIGDSDDHDESADSTPSGKRGGTRGRSRARRATTNTTRGQGRGRRGAQPAEDDNSLPSTSRSTPKERNVRGRGTASSRGGKQQQPTISGLLQIKRSASMQKDIQCIDIEDSDEDGIQQDSKRRKTKGTNNYSNKNSKYDFDDDNESIEFM